MDDDDRKRLAATFDRAVELYQRARPTVAERCASNRLGFGMTAGE
jgi:hypothetical protein